MDNLAGKWCGENQQQKMIFLGVDVDHPELRMRCYEGEQYSFYHSVYNVSANTKDLLVNDLNCILTFMACQLFRYNTPCHRS